MQKAINKTAFSNNDKYKGSSQQRFCVMRAVWFIGKFELLLNCTKYPIYSPKSRTPQQPQNVSSNAPRGRN